MPVYDYDCANCGHRFEVIHGVTADSPVSCPSCGGGPVRKAITAPAVHFKGSGWAKKERRASTSSASSTTSTDSKPADDAPSTDGAPSTPKTESPSNTEPAAAKPAAATSGSAD